MRQGSAFFGLVFGFWVFHEVVVQAVDHPFVVAVYAVEVLAWLTFLVQVPATFAMLHLDYEMRWYLLSDRSLRIREGLVKVQEKTIAFANIQNMTIRQGPLQRLLSIADLEVRTAGGGGAAAKEGNGGRHASGGDMHVARFRGVSDAAEIRDTIRECVRQHRDAGLGDPDDRQGRASAPATREGERPALVNAARELLVETRALRSTLTSDNSR